MGSEKMKLYDKLKSKPLIYFIIFFLVLSFLSITIGSYIANSYKNMFIVLGNTYFESNVNNEFELQRKVEIVPNNEYKFELRILITFFDKKNADESFPQKFIAINMINEGLVPTLLLIVLIISSPINLKRKFFSLITGFCLINLYIFFKLYAMSYDNYNSPEFYLKELPILINGIVYQYNHFLNITGYGFNLIITIVIWLISVIRISDIQKFKQIKF